MNGKRFYNSNDGSLHTLAEHMSFTPDEEWEEAGYATIEEYFNHLIDSRVLIEEEIDNVSKAGTALGRIKSDKKAASSMENGKKGGRPKRT